ncbi:FliM/FliN family flagellar motor C-terminal domain-containing protein [Xanthomonas cucurbitae]|uniref:FliM/FliN family flagellar motor C-terminal domain-containing protein n=1 Tax=Xanthomonas cucurbitae TaxID=56453 RepID=A0ABY7YD66_9XANT|nr:FliM/FliN family flagellar motor C-terminal domain-containing protein [Xanthomonas cucurbitae]WDM67832.1 FliM/FliN family flagellar motor C-terminal domain-containing protein [Xanthomonas cucurbitae]WDM71706.1 FliM/FliN family flagellar motor C-terminal domain-containing protein [Xanthomonas cucurbitae]
MKRLGWTSPSDAEVSYNLLRYRFSEWLKDWSVGSSAFDIQNVPEDALGTDVEVELPWTIYSSDARGELALCLVEPTASWLGAKLMQLTDSPDEPLCAQVGTEALQALGCMLARGEASASSSQAGDQFEPSRFSTRYGALAAVLHWEGCRFAVLADRAWHDNESKKTPAALPLLNTRRDALGTQKVQLHAHLTMGDLDLDEASALRVGEVLVLDQDSQILVQLASGAQVVGEGTLVRTGDARALEIH